MGELLHRVDLWTFFNDTCAADPQQHFGEFFRE